MFSSLVFFLFPSKDTGRKVFELNSRPLLDVPVSKQPRLGEGDFNSSIVCSPVMIRQMVDLGSHSWISKGI